MLGGDEQRDSLSDLRPDSVIDYAVRKIVRRSGGFLRCLSAYKLSDFSFSFIAQSYSELHIILSFMMTPRSFISSRRSPNCLTRGPCLEVLKIPVSSVTDKMVTKYAESLTNLTVLDISYCMKITWEGLEAFGKYCKSLIKLRRNMPPPDFDSVLASIASEVDEYEAITVADTMPGLIHLELGYGLFSDNGLDAILAKCRALCHLDIRGCWNVRLKGDLEDRCSRIKEFRSTWDDELENSTSSDSDFHGGNEA